MYALLLALPAHAASLDLLEVGGSWGTPGATNPTALWWNPAGLAVGGGKLQYIVEGAPTFATVIANRANPDYGVLDPSLAAEGYPIEYDYSGTDILKFTGVVPFVGVSSDFLVPGLGVGIGMAVPYARGGKSDQEWGANRYAIREGGIQAIDFIGAASYHIAEKLAVGASFHFVDSSYYANTDSSSYPQTVALAADQPGIEVMQDGFAEEQAYTTTAVFGGVVGNGDHGSLHDQAVSFGVGLYGTPLGDKLGLSVSYIHGMTLDHEGDLTLIFQCPEDYVMNGVIRGGTERQGLCNTTVNGRGAIGYDLPNRVNFGLVAIPIDLLRIEAMGAYVRWSEFTDFRIHTEVSADQFTAANTPEYAQESADLVSQDHLWARDNQDTFWLGLDLKARPVPMFTAGARIMYDHHAVPDQVVSANNLDNDEIILSALAEADPLDPISIGLSFSHHILVPRTVQQSAYSLTIDPEQAKPDRYFYPSARGTYGGSINRLGIVVRGHLGGTGW